MVSDSDSDVMWTTSHSLEGWKENEEDMSTLGHVKTLLIRKYIS